MLHAMRTRPIPRALLGVTLAAALGLGSCASIDIKRATQTSGTFESSGIAFTILSIDCPKPALNIARDNAADANLSNMQVTSVTIFPEWGWWDWVLDILSVRSATVRGTWGFTGAEPGAADAKAGSIPGS